MLYVGNDTLVMLCGIVDPFGSYLTSGSMTATITDPTGSAVATVTMTYLGTPVTIGGRNFADGNWSGTLVGSTALTVGDTYKVQYVCASPDLTFTHYEVAETRLA